MKPILFILFSLLIFQISSSQELNCTVDVNYDQVTGTETRKFETLETAIYEFMNNRKWTTEKFLINERIECAILVVVSEFSNNNYKTSIQIQSRRPVYNSGYHSTMLNYKDNDFNFTYIEYDPIEYNINTHLSNLTSVLAFYAYIIIGLDYDSFSLKGGSKYLDLAQKIVNNAQNANDAGWKAFEGDNRFALAQSLNDQFFSPLRECIYNYHAKGLDVMWTNVDGGRKVIGESLKGLEKIHQARPSSFLMKVFFNAKSDEVIGIYKDATPPEKGEISELLRRIDPGNSSKYNKITGG